MKARLVCGRGQRLDKPKGRAPGIDERPDIANESRQKAKPHPPGHPDGDRRDVLEGGRIAEQAGSNK